MIVKIGVDERTLLRHEIEIEVKEGSQKHVEDFLREIELQGIDKVEEIEKCFDGIEILEYFIEEVPNECDVDYEVYVVDIES